MRMLIATLLTAIGLLSSASPIEGATSPSVQVAGTWQGMLDVGTRQLRIVMQVRKGSAEAWDASVYSLDVSPMPIPVPWVRLQGSSLRLSVNSRAEYAGTISADGNHIEGKWMQGQASFPLNLERATANSAWPLDSNLHKIPLDSSPHKIPLDSSPHKIRFVTVEQGVKLEVLDWGGPGRPVILLAGLGNDAHVFDQFAAKLAAWYHVYGITRRGFGASNAPSTGYSADRLGEDVTAVMTALKIDRPVLIGHSLAGEELSAVGSRYPEKVAGLVYLDAAYAFAFYDTTGKALHTTPSAALQVTLVDIDDAERKLDQLRQMMLSGNQQKANVLIGELMSTDLSRVRRDLPSLAAVPSPPPVERAIFSGFEAFTSVRVPTLAIFADPHANATPPGAAPAQVTAAEALDKEFVEAQIAATERAAPGAHIVRLPHADHFVFRSNEDEVLKDIRGFIQALPQS